MSTLCCDKNTPNTGVFPCAKAIKKTVSLFFQAKYANDGTRNTIDIDSLTVLGTVGINAMLSDPDPSKRLYPISSMQDVDITASEPQYRTFKNQTKELTQEAVYSFMGLIAGDGVNPAIVKYLKKTNCREYQFYLGTSDGSIVGEISGTKLNGIDWTGFYAMGGFANFEKQSDVTIRFDFSETFKYENLYQLTADVLDIDILTATGVRPVNISVVSSTATTMAVRVFHDYGDGLVNKNNVVGLVPANFRIKRLDTGVVLTPSLATEDVVNQKYDLTFTTVPLTTPFEVYMNLAPTFKYEGLASGLIGV